MSTGARVSRGHPARVGGHPTRVGGHIGGHRLKRWMALRASVAGDRIRRCAPPVTPGRPLVHRPNRSLVSSCDPQPRVSRPGSNLSGWSTRPGEYLSSHLLVDIAAESVGAYREGRHLVRSACRSAEDVAREPHLARISIDDRDVVGDAFTVL